MKKSVGVCYSDVVAEKPLHGAQLVRSFVSPHFTMPTTVGIDLSRPFSIAISASKSSVDVSTLLFDADIRRTTLKADSGNYMAFSDVYRIVIKGTR